MSSYAEHLLSLGKQLHAVELYRMGNQARPLIKSVFINRE